MNRTLMPWESTHETRNFPKKFMHNGYEPLYARDKNGG